jgi:transcriptional regulator GlxA family with amidase domain
VGQLLATLDDQAIDAAGARVRRHRQRGAYHECLLLITGRVPVTTDNSLTSERRAGFRLGVYVFKDAEIVDFAAPYGVFSVARRYDPELDVFLIADAMRPVQAQAGFTVMPNYTFADEPAMDAFLIPGGFGTRQEMYNGRLHAFIRALPERCLLVSVCTGSWVYARMGLLDGLPATNRKEPDRAESGPSGKVPIDRLAELAPACRVSRARVVDAGRILTAGGITSGMEMGFHLLRRAGYDQAFIAEVARVMEYTAAYTAYRDDLEIAPSGVTPAR